MDTSRVDWARWLASPTSSTERIMGMPDADFDERVAGVASLAEPQRRALYRFVVGRGDAVSKDEAAVALGVARSVAAFHLERLVSDGLLTTEFRRLTGRRGPGAGRPAKLYRRAEGEVSVSLPARRYDLAAALLAAAVNEATQQGTPVDGALTQVSNARGYEVGKRVREEAGKRPSRRALLDVALHVLDEQGYEPHRRGDEIELANCPFHALVDDHRDLVCGMNRDFLGGMAKAVGEGLLTARLEPSEGKCCVRLDTSVRRRAPTS
jgi:predicted ArsR family transcriptional regulator